MKKIHLYLLVVLSLAFSYPAQAVVQIGEKAPEIALETPDGERIHLSDFKGMNVVLEWSNYMCPYVRKHYDSHNMQTLQETYTKKNVVWLTIMSSAPGKEGYYPAAELKKMNEKNGNKATYVLMDPEGTVGKTYDAKATPHMFIVDKEGVLVYNGAIDNIKSANIADIEKAENYVANALNALLDEKKIETAVTVPYGCSVKYAE